MVQTFFLQIEMRKNFLGEAYWTRKMHIFNEVRENIIKTADGTASRAVSFCQAAAIVYSVFSTLRSIFATVKFAIST